MQDPRTHARWIPRVPRPRLNRTAVVVATIGLLGTVAAAAIMKWPDPEDGLGASSLCEDALILIEDDLFLPAKLTVFTGDPVTWCAKGEKHSVAPTSGPVGFRGSGVLRPGEMHTVILDAPGTYTYECGHHSGMTGSITVLDPPGYSAT